MYSINTKSLLLKIFIPTSLLSLAYLVWGCLFQKIPYLLLFCILGTVILVPAELGMILSGQEKMPVWQILMIAMLFFGMAGLFSALIAVLFSLYHFWLPFNNIFRITIFAPVAYVAYRKKNLYISICFHCLCNLISVIGFIAGV